jgi:hypothetical protein
MADVIRKLCQVILDYEYVDLFRLTRSSPEDAEQPLYTQQITFELAQHTPVQTPVVEEPEPMELVETVDVPSTPKKRKADEEQKAPRTSRRVLERSEQQQHSQSQRNKRMSTYAEYVSAFAELIERLDMFQPGAVHGMLGDMSGFVEMLKLQLTSSVASYEKRTVQGSRLMDTLILNPAHGCMNHRLGSTEALVAFLYSSRGTVLEVAFSILSYLFDEHVEDGVTRWEWFWSSELKDSMLQLIKVVGMDCIARIEATPGCERVSL